MSGHLPRLLKCLLKVLPNKPQDSQHPAPQVTHGEKIQLALEEENLPILGKYGIALSQSIVGAALRFGRIIDTTAVASINEIVSQQLVPTENVKFDILVARLCVDLS